ncbi:MAG: TRAP transporter small permease [Gammaproteobacteria bacterium]|nr:TRAP transporter small permease [Gammaproteobacteria bacterium]
MVVVDVLMRNFGFQPPAHTLTLTEYALLYATMLASPWLVRTRGHVYIELLTAAVPSRVRVLLSRTVAALSLIVCVVLCWFAVAQVVDDYQRSVADIRSFDMPRWILFASMPLGFGLMAVEFLRFVFGSDVMHSGEAGIHE